MSNKLNNALKDSYTHMKTKNKSYELQYSKARKCCWLRDKTLKHKSCLVDQNVKTRP